MGGVDLILSSMAQRILSCIPQLCQGASGNCTSCTENANSLIIKSSLFLSFPCGES